MPESKFALCEKGSSAGAVNRAWMSSRWSVISEEVSLVIAFVFDLCFSHYNFYVGLFSCCETIERISHIIHWGRMWSFDNQSTVIPPLAGAWPHERYAQSVADESKKSC